MEWIKRIDANEPAMLRAVWVAVIAALAGVGVTVSEDLNGWVEVALITAGMALPLIQGVSTRAKVTPVAKLQADAAEWLDDTPNDAGRDGGDWLPPEQRIED